MNIKERFEYAVKQGMASVGFEHVDTEYDRHSNVSIMAFHAKGDEGNVVHITASGRELHMNENAVHLLALSKIQSAIRAFEAQARVAAA